MINLGRGWPDPSLLPPLQSLLSLSQAEIQLQQEQALQYGPDAGNLDMLQAIVQLRQQCRSANSVFYAEPEEGEISADPSSTLPDGKGEERDKSTKPCITTDNLIITNGSSQGLDMVCLRFSQPGDIILVEPLSYCYIAATIEQHGLIPMQAPSFSSTITATPDEPSSKRRASLLEESRGNLIDLDALEQTLESRKTKGLAMPKLLYTVPICHNPTGTTMEEDEAKRLILLARKYQFKVVSDEVYMFLAFNCETVPKSLVDYEMELVKSMEDQDDSSSFAVLALNSFSKILGPGVRLGWIESSPDNIKTLEGCGAIVSGGGLNPLGCSIVGAYLRSGQQQKLVETLNVSYRTRCKVLMDALELDLGALPVTVEQILQPEIKYPVYVRVTGGFFLWLRFPNHWKLDTKELLKICLEQTGEGEDGEDESVSFFAGYRFSMGVPLLGGEEGSDANKTSMLVPEVANHSIRLCFAYLQEDEINKGISFLARTAYDIVYSSK